MAKWYLRSSASSSAPTTGSKSASNPKSTLGSNQASSTQQSYAMLPTAGAAAGGTNVSLTSDNTTAARTNFMGRWTGPRLQAQSIPAQDWTIALGLNESNTNADSFTSICIYTAASGGSAKKQTIYDSADDLGTEWAASTTGAGRVYTVAGAAVSADRGDVICVEVFRNASQSMGTAYSQVLFFDGAVEPTANSNVTANNVASYLESPADLAIDATVSIVSPADGGTVSDTTPDLQFTGSAPSGNNLEFQVQIHGNNTFGSGGFDLKYADLRVGKVGSPTDDVIVDIVAGSVGGTVIGSSNAVAASGISASPSFVRFTFSSAISLDGGTQYWAVLRRTGARSTSNYINWPANVFNPYAGGSQWTLGSGSWSELSASDLGLRLFDATPTQKIETTDSGGSGQGVFGSGGTQEAQAQSFTTAADTTLVNALSETDAGFSNITNGGDTHPFNNDDTIQYTVQSALSETTYYWRVRAKDTGGTGNWSAWDTRSFEVSTSGSVSIAGSVSGTSATAGTLSVAKSLAGAVTGTSTTSLALTVARELAMAVAGTALVVCALILNIPLASAITGTSDATADISVERQIAGSVTGTSAASAELNTEKPLEGSVAGTSSATADISTDIGITGDVTGTSDAIANIEVAKPIEGSVTGTSDTTAAINVGRQIAGDVAGTSDADATLSIEKPIEAVEAGTSSATATLSIDTGPAVSAGYRSFSAFWLGGASAPGETIPIAGAVTGTSLATLTINAGRPIEGAVTGTSDTTLDISIERALSGSVTGTSDATADISASKQIAGSVTGTSSATLSLSGGLITYVSDTFTDTNGTELESHTPDLGGPWDVVLNPTQWTIQGNELSRPAATVDWAIVQIGDADMEVSADFTHLENLCAVIARYDSPTNFWEVYFDYAEQAWQLNKVVAGIDTPVGPLLGGATGIVKLRCEGNEITAFSPNGDRYTTTDSFNNTQTKAGLILDGFSSVASTVDNFLATSPTAIIVEVEGAVSGTSDTTLALTVDREIAGSVTGPSDATAVIDAAKPLTLSVAGTSDATADLDVAKSIAGSATGTSAATLDLGGDRDMVIDVAGTSAASLALTVSKELAGSVAGTSDATLDLTAQLAGSVSGTSDTTLALTADRELAGSVAGTSDASATIEVGKRVSGNVAGTSDATLALDVAKPLTLSVTGTSDTTLSLAGDKEIEGVVIGTSDATLALTVDKALASAITGASDAQAALTVIKELVGDTVGTGDAVLDISVAKQIAGSVIGTSEAVLEMRQVVRVEGDVVGTSDATLTLTLAKQFAGVVTGTSTATADVRSEIAPFGLPSSFSVIPDISSFEVIPDIATFEAVNDSSTFEVKK